MTQEEKKAFWDKFKVWKKAQSSVEQSKRFEVLGYLKYPMREQLDYRLFHLIDILQEIETETEIIDTSDPAKLQAHAYKSISRLFKAFLTIGAPWFRGLDNRELAKKAVTFFKLETMIGHLPSFYPDLKLCTETLINLSWQAIDVTAEPPILFETKTQIMPQQQRPLKLGDLEQIGNTDREDSEE